MAKGANLKDLHSTRRVKAINMRLVGRQFSRRYVRSINLRTEPAAALIEINHCPVRHQRQHNEYPDRDDPLSIDWFSRHCHGLTRFGVHFGVALDGAALDGAEVVLVAAGGADICNVKGAT